MLKTGGQFERDVAMFTNEDFVNYLLNDDTVMLKRGYEPNTYPLYNVYMGSIIEGPPSQGYHHFLFELLNEN